MPWTVQWLAALLAALAIGSGVVIGVAYVVQAVIAGDPVRLKKEHISTFARELAAHWVYGVTAPFGLIQTAPTPYGATMDPEEGDTPVLLLPGYGVNRACMFFLAAYLRRRGWRWVWPVTNRPRGGGVELYAARLASHIDRLRAVTGAEQVDIVAHSMGGVVAAWTLLSMGRGAQVRRLITLGTPWAGSRLAVFGRLKEARDMLPGAPLLAQLGPLPVPVTSLYSRWDHMVIPSDSALVPWARMVEIPRSGHLEMLYSARAYRAVAHLLRAEAGAPEVAAEAPTPMMASVEAAEA